MKKYVECRVVNTSPLSTAAGEPSCREWQVSPPVPPPQAVNAENEDPEPRPACNALQSLIRRAYCLGRQTPAGIGKVINFAA